MDPGIAVLNAAACRSLDQYVIQHEPISSADLMERASYRLFQTFTQLLNTNRPLHIICGPGNNGGDGLCLSRIFASAGYKVRCSLLLFGKPPSADLQLQRNLLSRYSRVNAETPDTAAQLHFSQDEVLIDCIFGTGLNSALTGEWADAVDRINQSGCDIYAVDMPSGLLDSSAQGNAPFVQAGLVLTIQHPKPALLFAENRISFKVIDAGIRGPQEPQEVYFLDPQNPAVFRDMEQQLPRREKHSHKGSYGHTLVIGGGHGMYGAAAMASRSAYEAGSGLTTVWAPSAAAANLAETPEVMFHAAPHTPEDFPAGWPERFNAVLIGPGLGQSSDALALLRKVLDECRQPLVIDADGLNLIAANPESLSIIPAGSLLTPHPGELKRLAGHMAQGLDLEQRLKAMAMERKIFILAKNTYSLLACPDGTLFYNGSGDHQLARGGSGDKLAGTIAGLYAQHGDMRRAALAGMFFSGIPGYITSLLAPRPV